MQERRFQTGALIIAVLALLCLVWLTARVVNGETMQFDGNVRSAIHSAASPLLTRLFEATTTLGSQAVVIGVATCAALIFFSLGRWSYALVIAIVMSGAELALWILKIQFHRQRPD